MTKISFKTVKTNFMEISTKFAIGDKVWKIHDSKAVCFEIGCILYDGAVYYGETRYDVTISTQCFATKEELIKYITSE